MRYCKECKYDYEEYIDTKYGTAKVPQCITKSNIRVVESHYEFKTEVIKEQEELNKHNNCEHFSHNNYYDLGGRRRRKTRTPWNGIERVKRGVQTKKIYT